MQGKIVKGISGFYYVHVGEPGIYECKAKGAFRNQKIKPLVGDDVEIAIVDEETKKGNIEKILPRKNELIRPAVANIDLALIIFAAAKPQPNFNLLVSVFSFPISSPASPDIRTRSHLHGFLPHIL